MLFELPCSELRPNISDNIIWPAKPVHDFLDEFHRLGRFDGSDRLYFDSLCEFIHCNKDMFESPFSFLEWNYQIHPPCRERSGNRYGLQLVIRRVSSD
jgi:hypothetical protein